jgi:hypothetical protein
MSETFATLVFKSLAIPANPGKYISIERKDQCSK